MTLHFRCPKCGAALHARDQDAGKMGICQSCSLQIRLPPFHKAPEPSYPHTSEHERLPDVDNEKAVHTGADLASPNTSDGGQQEGRLKTPERRSGHASRWTAIALALLLSGVAAKITGTCLTLPQHPRGYTWGARAVQFVLPLISYSVILAFIAFVIARVRKKGNFSLLAFGILWLVSGALDLGVDLYEVLAVRPAVREYLDTKEGPSSLSEAVSDAIEKETNRSVPELVEALRSEDFPTRFWACAGLEEHGDRAVTAVPELIKCVLHDEYATIRVQAAGILGSLGPKAKEAIPALERASHKDENESVRSEAAWALKRIQMGSNKPSIQTLNDGNCKFSYLSSWVVTQKEESVRPGVMLKTFTLRSPRDSHVILYVLDSAADTDKWLGSVSSELTVIVEAQQRTTFSRWGAYKGQGIHLQGQVMGFDGGVRAFAHSTQLRAFFVQEMYYSEELNDVGAGFELVKSSFRLLGGGVP